MKVLVPLLILVILITGCAVPAEPVSPRNHPRTDNLTRQELYALDLAFIYEEIRDNYVNLTYKEQLLELEWEQTYHRYQQKMANAHTEQDFYAIASAFIYALRDGHMTLIIADPDIAGSIFPYGRTVRQTFEVRLIEEKAIVVSALKQWNIVGMELLAINGMDFLEIAETMTKHYYFGSIDEAALTSVLRGKRYIDYFAFYESPLPLRLHLELRDRSGEHHELVLDPYDRYPSGPMDSMGNIVWDSAGGMLSHEVLPQTTIGYLRIPTFEVPIKEHNKALQQAIADFREAGVTGVILDLRYNGGGNSSFRDTLGYLTDRPLVINSYRYRESERFSQIYRLRALRDRLFAPKANLTRDAGYTRWYLWEVSPNKENFLTTIPIVVLTNEAAFSSADGFVNAVMEHSLATVVGSRIPLSGHGLPTSILLPSRNYALKYAFQEVRSAAGEPMENMVREPDILVYQRLDHFYESIDSHLQMAIEYLEAL